jgi:hypothetical protein
MKALPAHLAHGGVYPVPADGCPSGPTPEPTTSEPTTASPTATATSTATSTATGETTDDGGCLVPEPTTALPTGTASPPFTPTPTAIAVKPGETPDGQVEVMSPGGEVSTIMLYYLDVDDDPPCWAGRAGSPDPGSWDSKPLRGRSSRAEALDGRRAGVAGAHSGDAPDRHGPLRVASGHARTAVKRVLSDERRIVETVGSRLLSQAR